MHGERKTRVSTFQVTKVHDLAKKKATMTMMMTMMLPLLLHQVALTRIERSQSQTTMVTVTN